jgi:LmbE family N-acetylglucosaminyl deacetylase
MSKTVLVVAAHSDDEVLGAGGTIAKHAECGDDVHVLFLTDGVGARASDAQGKKDKEKRLEAAKVALETLGVSSFENLDFPDNKIDSVPLLDVTQSIERFARNKQPEIVYTHSLADLNVDHRLCQQAVLTAFRPLPNQTVRNIYAFEVASSTEWGFAQTEGRAFRPTHFVDVTKTMQKKLKALDAYKDEMRMFPHARSIKAIEALATWRGATVGCSAAEAFEVIRSLNI